MGVIAACNEGTRSAAGAAPAGGGGAAPPPAAPPRSIASIPPGAPTLNWIPKHEELVYTFGGAAPAQRIKPGTRIVTWTEDCFDGAVKTAADLPSKVMAPGHDNPQTGPFYVEGAEPGDTLAVHILKLEPARPYAVSSFSPGFGALVGNDQTAMLGTGLPGDDLALRRGREAQRRPQLLPRRQALRGRCRSRRSSAASASRPRAARCARRSSPGTSAATWTARRCARGTRCISASTCRARWCRSATATTRWATARSWAPPSRAR